MRNHLGVALWLLTTAAVGSWFAVMNLDTQAPYTYESGTLLPDPVKQGGRATLIWRIKVNRTCPGSVQRTLVDNKTNKVVAQYDPTPSALTVQMGDTQLKKTFLLPDDLPEEIRYEAEVSFRCNALQALFPIKVRTPSVVFHVQ